MQTKPPRAAYLHVPFCRRRCGYCNFTLVAGRDDLIDDYLLALERELQQLERPRDVDTIFIGGGTPSHLPPKQLRRLLALTTTWFPIGSGAEFSIEANPEDINPQQAAAIRAGAVTRVSLGVQSFDADKLRSLEREHSAEDATDAVQRLRDEGLNVSLDLIFAAPGESLSIWESDLEMAISLNVDHISTYGLTFDQGAAFWSQRNKGSIEQAEEDLEAEMYELAIDRLRGAGFEHYEVSNFARPGMRCRHNEAYWLGRSYFAAGPGAARYVDGRRETNHRSTTTYIRRMLRGESPVAEVDAIAGEARVRERFAFALRRLEGVDCRQFERETGFQPFQLFEQPLNRFLELGLLEREQDQVRLTRAGLLVSDSMLVDLL